MSRALAGCLVLFIGCAHPARPTLTAAAEAPDEPASPCEVEDDCYVDERGRHCGGELCDVGEVPAPHVSIEEPVTEEVEHASTFCRLGAPMCSGVERCSAGADGCQHCTCDRLPPSASSLSGPFSDSLSGHP